MPRLAPLAALAVALVTLSACDAPADDPPLIVIEPPDMALPPDSEPPPDMAPDAALPDAEPPDVGPLCSNPCDDGDPGTTRDRCIDDVCTGDPLPAMLVLAGDLPRAGRPAADALRLVIGADGLAVEALDAVVPRGRVTASARAPQITRTVAALARTAVMRFDGDRFVEDVRVPAVPDARVHTYSSARVLAGDDEGPVVHISEDGGVTPLGIGLADGRAFIGHADGALVARELGGSPGEVWTVDPASTGELDGGQVLRGLGFVPRDDGLLVINPGDRETATVPIDGPLRRGGDWVAVEAGSDLMRVVPWPPSVEPQPITWTDARFVDGGLIALDAEGTVWWIALDASAAAPVERGTLPAGATLLDLDGLAVARTGDALFWLTADAEPRPLPGADADAVFAGLLDDWLVFVSPTRAQAIDFTTGERQSLEGGFGAPVGRDLEGLLVRAAPPRAMTLARLDGAGITPLSTVWTPEPRTVNDEVDWVRIGGDTAAFVAEPDGPLMTLDLADPAAEPIPAGRLRFGERWAIGGVTADGRWVVWRAGDEIVGSLRGARTDGSHFPDGIELVRSRAYPPLMAPDGARLALAFDPRPTGGFPIVDLDREDPSAATWVVSEGLGLFPLAWVDGETLLVGLCTADGEAVDGCDDWGLGRVDLVGDTPVFAPLVGRGLLRPEWGRTVLVAGEQLYAVRAAGIGRFQIRRIALDGRGNWSTVAEGSAPTRLIGAADGGVVYTVGGVLQHADTVDGGVDVELPGPVAGFGPLGFERPLTVLADTVVVGLPDAPCFDCRAWRLSRDAAPTPLGEGTLLPLAWSPAGDVLVQGRLDDGHLAPVLTDDTEGPLLPLPAPMGDDVRVLRWVE